MLAFNGYTFPKLRQQNIPMLGLHIQPKIVRDKELIIDRLVADLPGLHLLGPNGLYPDVPASFVGFRTSLVVAVLVSLLTQQSDPAKVLTNADGEAMDLNDRLGTLPLFRRVD